MSLDFDGKFKCDYCLLEYDANNNVLTLQCDDEYADDCPTGISMGCLECEHVEKFCQLCWQDKTGERL